MKRPNPLAFSPSSVFCFLCCTFFSSLSAYDGVGAAAVAVQILTLLRPRAVVTVNARIAAVRTLSQLAIPFVGDDEKATKSHHLSISF